MTSPRQQKALAGRPELLLFEATTGFEPVMRVLQTLALPLGHVAKAKPAGQSPAGYFTRAGDEIRTHDLLLGKETFYH